MENGDKLETNSIKIKEIEEKITDIINFWQTEEGNQKVNENELQEHLSKILDYNDLVEYEDNHIEEVKIDSLKNTLKQWIHKCKTKAYEEADELKDLNINEINENYEKYKQHQKDIRRTKDPHARKVIELSRIHDFYINGNQKSPKISLSPPKFKKMHEYVHEIYNTHKPKVDNLKRNEITHRLQGLKIKKIAREKILEIHGKNHEKVKSFKVNVSSSVSKNNLTELPRIEQRVIDKINIKNKKHISNKMKNSIEWVRYGLI